MNLCLGLRRDGRDVTRLAQIVVAGVSIGLRKATIPAAFAIRAVVSAPHEAPRVLAVDQYDAMYLKKLREQRVRPPVVLLLTRGGALFDQAEDRRLVHRRLRRAGAHPPTRKGHPVRSPLLGT